MWHITLKSSSYQANDTSQRNEWHKRDVFHLSNFFLFNGQIYDKLVFFKCLCCLHLNDRLPYFLLNSSHTNFFLFYFFFKKKKNIKRHICTKFLYKICVHAQLIVKYNFHKWKKHKKNEKENHKSLSFVYLYLRWRSSLLFLRRNKKNTISILFFPQTPFFRPFTDHHFIPFYWININ